MCVTALSDSVYPPAVHTTALFTVAHISVEFQKCYNEELGLFYALSNSISAELSDFGSF